MYDIKDFHDHPGGSVAFAFCGKDATSIFNALHAATARKYLSRFEIQPSSMMNMEVAPSLDIEFRELQRKLELNGFYRAAPAREYWNKTFLGVLFVASQCCATYFFNCTLTRFLAAVAMGFFWLRQFYFCHDIGHVNPIGTSNLQLFASNVILGYSLSWWKLRHGIHHAVPNVHDPADSRNRDPDVDFRPFAAFTKSMALGPSTFRSLFRFFVPIQHITYLPLMSLGRIMFLTWSMNHAYIRASEAASAGGSRTSAPKQRKMQAYMELISLLVHHFWVGLMCRMVSSTYGGAFSFWLLAQATGGLLLFGVAGLGHYGCTFHEDATFPSFVLHQITSTCNVSEGFLVNWLCGGLEYQVEHHLFPRIPHEKLPKVHAILVPFLKRHGLAVKEASLLSGAGNILRNLYRISLIEILE